MDQFISMTLAVILLISTFTVGLQAYDIYSAVVTVRSALTAAELELASDGGVSNDVAYIVARRMADDRRDLSRVQVTGTSPGVAWGGQVTLTVTYDHPYMLSRLLPDFQWVGYEGTFRIQKSLTTISGVVPSG